MVNYEQKATDALRQVREQLTEQLDHIDAALAALGEGARSPKQSRRKKPCCTKSEVVEIIAGLLNDNGSLSRTELEELAKEKISRELGKNLSGFAMRFREALGEPQFSEFAPGEYLLKPKENR